MRWNIKQMAETSRISADSLRYYEKLGIVSTKRAENGYRYYDEKDYVYLQYISTMKYAHFSLADIKTVIQSFEAEANYECYKKNFDIFTKKRAELIKTIENYKNIVKLLDELIPIMDGTKDFLEYEEEITSFVQEVFYQINENSKINNVKKILKEKN